MQGGPSAGADTGLQGLNLYTLDLEAIGPQVVRESGLSRRLRFHQSWYRWKILGLDEYGTTPAPHHRPLGSILSSDAAAAGMNFTSSEAAFLYRTRRGLGWGVDPIRCTSYLTSSQALTLNIMGPLSQDLKWLIRVLSRITNRSDLLSVINVEVEYAPTRRSEFLGDMTRVDGFVLVNTSEGIEAIVLEFKYSDRFNSRRLDLEHNPAYLKLADSTGLWLRPEATFTDKAVNQLVRCHALAASVLLSKGRGERTSLIVFHHSDDAPARSIVGSYRAQVHRTEDVVSMILSQLLVLMAEEAPDEKSREQVQRLCRRYDNEESSEAYWREHLMRSSNARGR